MLRDSGNGIKAGIMPIFRSFKRLIVIPAWQLPSGRSSLAIRIISNELSVYHSLKRQNYETSWLAIDLCVTLAHYLSNLSMILGPYDQYVFVRLNKPDKKKLEKILRLNKPDFCGHKNRYDEWGK